MKSLFLANTSYILANWKPIMGLLTMFAVVSLGLFIYLDGLQQQLIKKMRLAQRYYILMRLKNFVHFTPQKLSAQRSERDLK
ncbi:MAG: hypothetical protein V3T17_07385 [Pseudomonadales bacterium]